MFNLSSHPGATRNVQVNRPMRLGSFSTLWLLGDNLFGGRIGVTEIRELFPRRGQVKLAELLGQLERLADNAFLLVIVAQLEFRFKN